MEQAATFLFQPAALALCEQQKRVALTVALAEEQHQCWEARSTRLAAAVPPQVKDLKEGKAVQKPIYNHVTGLLDPPEEIKVRAAGLSLCNREAAAAQQPPAASRGWQTRQAQPASPCPLAGCVGTSDARCCCWATLVGRLTLWLLVCPAWPRRPPRS